MAYERVWQPMAVDGPHVNLTAGDGVARFLWTCAQMLLGRIGTAATGLWTIVGSADNATFGLDGIDRWTGTYPGTAVMPFSLTSGGAHAWMVLSRQYTVHSISYTVYLLLSCRGNGASSTGRFHVRMGLSMPTGGSLTADPTMANLIHDKSSIDFGNSYGADLAAQNRMYGNVCENGDFWFVETQVGEAIRCISLFQPVGCKTNDQCPFWGHSADYAGSGFPFGAALIYTRGAVSTYSAGPGLYYNGAVGYPAIDPILNAIAPYLDASDVSLFDRPAYVVVGNAASPTAIHSRGRLADAGICSGYNTSPASSVRPCNVGTTVLDPDNNALVRYVTINQFILPYNALLS